jgi:hypothetical protein
LGDKVYTEKDFGMPRKKKEITTKLEEIKKLPAVELAKTKRAEIVQLELTTYTSDQLKKKLQAAIADLQMNEILASLLTLVEVIPEVPKDSPKELVNFVGTIKENIHLHYKKIMNCYDRALSLISESLNEGAAQIPSNIYNIRDALRTLAEGLDSDDSTMLYSACRRFQSDIGRVTGHISFYTQEDLDHVSAKAEEKGYERGLKSGQSTVGLLDLPDID